LPSCCVLPNCWWSVHVLKFVDQTYRSVVTLASCMVLFPGTLVARFHCEKWQYRMSWINKCYVICWRFLCHQSWLVGYWIWSGMFHFSAVFSSTGIVLNGKLKFVLCFVNLLKGFERRLLLNYSCTLQFHSTWPTCKINVFPHPTCKRMDCLTNSYLWNDVLLLVWSIVLLLDWLLKWLFYMWPTCEDIVIQFCLQKGLTQAFLLLKSGIIRCEAIQSV